MEVQPAEDTKEENTLKDVSSLALTHFADLDVLALPRAIKTRSITRRAIWLFVFATAFIFTSFLIAEILSEYKTFPTDISIKIVSETDVIFPAVTVCNLNLVMKSKINGTPYEELIRLDEKLKAAAKDLIVDEVGNEYTANTTDQYLANLTVTTQTIDVVNSSRFKRAASVFECEPGFEISETESGLTCVDVNECSPDTGKCPVVSECKNPHIGTCPYIPSLCINTNGSFECHCPPGYMDASAYFTNMSGLYDVIGCIDINECDDHQSICSQFDATPNCTNIDGSFLCTGCPPGYVEVEGFRNLCSDIDECKTFVHRCAPNVRVHYPGMGEEGGMLPTSSCMNTNGSYTCSCRNGFSGDGESCFDEDDCISPQEEYEYEGGCPVGAVCVNYVGNYFDCQCPAGYSGDPWEVGCSDINECHLNTTHCSDNSICINTNGSFKCQCKNGYTGNGANVCQPMQNCSGDTDVEICLLGIKDDYDYEGMLNASKSSDYTDLANAIRLSNSELQEYSQSSTELIIQCTFDKQTCYPDTDFTRFLNHKYGSCYTFNSKSQKNKKHTSRTGTQYGLVLTLNIQREEYVGLLSPVLGARITVHDADEQPSPQDRGINLPPDSRSEVSVKRKLLTRTKPPHGVCVDRSELAVGYTTLLCKDDCMLKRQIKKCGCAERAPLLTEYNFQNSGRLCNISNITNEICLQSIRRDFKNGIIQCLCPPPCRQWYFETRVTQTVYPSDSYRNLIRTAPNTKHLQEHYNDSNSHNLVSVHLYLEELTYDMIVEKPTYSGLKVLSDAGGIISLYIGVSVITLLELLELFYDFLKLIYMKLACHSC